MPVLTWNLQWAASTTLFYSSRHTSFEHWQLLEMGPAGTMLCSRSYVDIVASLESMLYLIEIYLMSQLHSPIHFQEEWGYGALFVLHMRWEISCVNWHNLQLKSLVSALYNSGMNSTKHFCKAGNYFGWDTIERMWTREVGRSECGEMAVIPRMKASYVYRDSLMSLQLK